MQNAVASWHPCIPAIAKRYSDLDSQVRSGRVSLNDAVAQYAWVTKDRDGNDALGLSRLASAIPTEADDGELSIPFVITTFTEDRDGDVVRPQGIQLHNFANNPVCSFGHFQNPYYPLPVAKCKSPDGRLTINLEENRATCVMYFDREDEFAVKVYKKYKSGYLNATSIAFVPLQAQRRDREAEKGLYENRAHTHVSPMSPPGWRFDAVDLTEIACVPVPANAGAIRDWMDTDKGLTAAQRKALLPYAAKSLGRSFSGWCPPGTTLCPDGTCKAVKSVGGAANVLPAVHESPADEPEVAVVVESNDKLDRLITEVAKQNELLGKLLAKNEATKEQTQSAKGASAVVAKSHGTCDCGGEAACSCKRGTKAVEPLLPKRSRGGEVLLPTREVQPIFERMHWKLDNDPAILTSSEWRRWQQAVTEHYVNLRTVEQRLGHRRDLQQAFDALVSAAKRRGITVTDTGGVLPSDGAKQLRADGEPAIPRQGRDGRWYVYDQYGTIIEGPFPSKPAAEAVAKRLRTEVGKPFAGYTDFKDCMSKNRGKHDPEAYCATIMREVEGKGIGEVGKQLAESSGTAGGYTVPVQTATDVTAARTEAVCPACGGSGECDGCSGAGETAGKLCDLCGGSGECGGCAGAGIVAKSVGKSETLPQPSQAAGNAQRRAAQIAALKRRIQLLSSPTLDQRPEDKAKVEEYKRQLAELQGSKSLQQQPHNRIKNHMTQAR